MAEPMPRRDYGLAGASTRWALEAGLASAEWYHSDVPRAAMKALMQRSDQPAIRDTGVWLGVAASLRRRRDLVLGHLVVRALLRALRRPLRLGLRLPLARVRRTAPRSARSG